MPVEATYRNLHSGIPGEVSGYELSPGTGKGLWSIVSPLGVVTNLNDLGLQVTAYTGAGMPPVDNITTPLGILGGSYLQRTVIRPRTIVLSCVAQGLTLGVVQRIKNAIIAQIAPYNSLSTAKALKLHYQLTNNCGDAVGTALEVAVTWAGDLTGNTTNLYQDRFDLQFVEFNPPSIKELTTIQPSLSYLVSRASSQGIRYRLATTGEWKFISLSTAKAVHYDQVDNLWYASNATVTNRNGTTTQAINNSALAIASNINNDIFVGGGFTTPQNFIMGYNGSSWVALFNTPPPSNINGVVRALLFGNDGALYIGGDFTLPQFYIIKYTYNTLGVDGGYVNLGVAPGPVRALINGLDGNIYVGGDNFISKFNPTAITFTDIASGVNASVNTLALLPDGRVVAGGAFTTIGGTTANLVAVYNGTGWQQLGNGLTAGEVTKIAVNNVTGDIYATGTFTASGNVPLPGGFAKFNGSNWVPSDATNLLSAGNKGALAIRKSDNELAIASDNTSSTLTNGGSNAIVYAGTADVFPQIKFTGPGTLWSITNYTTGKTITFNNYTLKALETVLFTFDQATGLSFVSSVYGTTVLNKVLSGSDISAFSLVAGQTNYIVPYLTATTGATKVELIYQNTHFSFEAGAA
jgi:hypothetical protein